MTKQPIQFSECVTKVNFLEESLSIFRNILTSYGKMKLSEEDAEELLTVVDADGDDLLDYEEFVRLFTDKGVIIKGT